MITLKKHVSDYKKLSRRWENSRTKTLGRLYSVTSDIFKAFNKSGETPYAILSYNIRFLPQDGELHTINFRIEELTRRDSSYFKAVDVSPEEQISLREAVRSKILAGLGLGKNIRVLCTFTDFHDPFPDS